MNIKIINLIKENKNKCNYNSFNINDNISILNEKVSSKNYVIDENNNNNIINNIINTKKEITNIYDRLQKFNENINQNKRFTQCELHWK